MSLSQQRGVLKRVFGWTTVQSHRMEFYAVVAMIVAALGVSHMFGYWPHGLSAEAGKQTPQDSGTIEGGMQELVWRIVFIATLVLVAVLFYLARRQSASNSPVIASVPAAPILSDSDAVIFRALKTEFDLMPWAERIALRYVYQRAMTHMDVLALGLKNCGFGRDIKNDIVIPLMQKRLFVNVTDMKDIERHPGNAKLVEAILAEWEKHPF